MGKVDPLSTSKRAHHGRFDASAVLEHMADGFIVLDPAWTCIYVNATAESLLRQPRDALLGLDHWSSPVSLAGTSAEPEMRRAMADRSVTTFDFEFRGRLLNARLYPLPAGSLAVRLRDITDQRRGEERLRLALDATGLGLWDYEVGTDAVFWDARTRAICGAPPGFAPQGEATFEQVLHPDDRARVLELQRAAREPGAPDEFTMEFRVVGLATGEERWVVSTGRVVRDPEGRAVRVLGTKLDITERKRAEQELEQNEERLRLAISAIGLGTWDHDLVTDKRTWSAPAKALLGLPPDREASRELLSRVMHPEDEPRTARAYAAARDPDRGGEYRNEIRIRRHDDGAERWLALHGRVLFDRARRPVRALGIVRDVTEAKLAEARLRQLNESLEARVAERTRELQDANRALAAERTRLAAVLEQLPIGVLVVAPSGSLVFQNEAARRIMARDLTGLRRWDDFAGIGAVHSDGAPLDAGEYALVRAVRDGVATARKLQPYETGDGRRVTLEVSAWPVRGLDGAIELGVLAFEDISARLDAEEALRRAQRLEAIGQLTGGVAHDFNNLLTAILGNLEILGRRVSEARSVRLVENATRAADRGARLTAQLLAFARKQRLQTQAVDVDLLVRAMSALLRSTLGGTIEMVLPEPRNLWRALADPTQLELVILNLAINARDAMPDGGRLTIEAENAIISGAVRPEDPPPGNFVALTVTDTGTGMPPEVLARAFEPFFTTKEVGKGSGLGLPQVLGVAQQLGGGVRIASRSGAGTSVTVYLPQAHPADDQPPAPEPGVRDHSLAGLSILLVDDDADVREITADLLHELGASVVPAADGIEAMARVGSHFDAVLLDFAMPLMNGSEIAGHIRQLYPTLPILLVTGHSDELVAPASGSVLRKPFQAASLAAAIRHEIARMRARGA